MLFRIFKINPNFWYSQKNMGIFHAFITIHKHSFASHAKKLKDVLGFLKHSLSVSFAIWHRIHKHNKILIANKTTNLITFPLDLSFSHIILHKSNWKLVCWFIMDFWFLLFVSTLLRRGSCFAHPTKIQEVMTSMEEKKGNSSPKKLLMNITRYIFLSFWENFHILSQMNITNRIW